MPREFLSMLAILGYCLISAFSRVFTSNLLQNYDPALLCFYIFTFGALVFTISNAKEYINLYPKLQNNYLTIFYLNVTTMGSWLFLLYPLKFLEPAIVSTITLGIGPIVSLLLSNRFYKRSEKSLYDILIALGLFLVIAFLIKLSLSVKMEVSLYHKVTSIICCIIVGISIVLNGFQTRRLIDLKFSALDILMLRFYLLIAVSGAIAYLSHPDANILEGFVDKTIFISSVIFVVLPLFLIQIGLRALKPITVSVLLPLMPVLTYFFELQHQRINILNDTLYAILTMFVLISLATYFRLRGKITP